MVLTRFLGSRLTRSVTVLSVLGEAKRAFSDGRTVRSLALLGVAAVAWKWAIVGMAVHGLLKALPTGGSSGESAESSATSA